MNTKFLNQFFEDFGDDCVLVAVVKNRSLDNIQNLVDFGLNDLGFNRVEDAKNKIPLIKNFEGNFHFIGNIQKRKIKYILENFDLIHSVNSFGIMEEINRRAGLLGIQASCLAQINIDNDKNKNGFFENDFVSLISEIKKFKNIKLKGLMTIGKKNNKNTFSDLRLFFEKIKHNFDHNFKELSMGMSNDFQNAIVEGATIVRVGRALF